MFYLETFRFSDFWWVTHVKPILGLSISLIFLRQISIKDSYLYPYSQSYGFSSTHVWIWELDYKESWALKNWCFWTVVLEKTLESPLDCREIKPVNPKENQSWIFNWKDWCWSWNSNTLAIWWDELTHWKRPWCWERLKVGEGDNRGWDGWMASPTQWTWVWISSKSWWWIGKPGLLQSMGSQSQTQLSDWIELMWNLHRFTFPRIFIDQVCKISLFFC